LFRRGGLIQDEPIATGHLDLRVSNFLPGQADITAATTPNRAQPGNNNQRCQTSHILHRRILAVPSAVAIIRLRLVRGERGD
jgi:hypothetical protein